MTNKQFAMTELRTDVLQSIMTTHDICSAIGTKNPAPTASELGMDNEKDRTAIRWLLLNGFIEVVEGTQKGRRFKVTRPGRLWLKEKLVELEEVRHVIFSS